MTKVVYTYSCLVCGRKFNRTIEAKNPTCRGCKRKLNPKWQEISLKKTKAYKTTMLKKYGVDNPSKLPEVIADISKKAKERFANAEIKKIVLDKRRTTNLLKYGYKSASKHPDIIKKNVDSQMRNQGYVGWQNKELQERAEILAHSIDAEKKRKETFLRIYGVDHPMKLEENIKKAKATYKKKTGYDHPAHNPEIIHSNKGYLFNDIHFDSSWELAYYLWLRDNKKSFIYHPNTPLDYYDKKGIARKYYPDFLIEGEFIEIKGDHFFNEKNEPYNYYEKDFWWGKYNTLLRNNVKILRFEEVKKYLKYVKDKYGKDYLKSFKCSKLFKVQRLSKAEQA